MAASEAGTRRRVKLYMLNDERQWDDKGTGHVSAQYTEQNSMALVVISETDGSYLLESKILPDTAYQKQQETLIVWSEGENMDLALSFQEKVGCDDVWEKICAVQGKDPSVEITQEVVDESDDVDDADGYTSSLIQGVQPLSLPPCELGHLEETVEMITQAVASVQKRDRLVTLLESTNYLSQLTDLFHKAEDLEDMESLRHLYEIMRQLILINKQSLYETLFSDEMLMDVVGMLEYNPSGRTKHRDFLRNKANFKEVLPFHNSDLVSKIHQTYRVQYIQDCCLPPPCLFDEHTLSQLKTFVSLNKMEIIRALQEDEEFMRCLFARLKSPDTDLGHRKELSLFVKEFCNISIQTDQKESFLNCLLQHGALRTAEVLLSIDDRDIKSAALEMLQAFVEHQPSVVREYVYKETAPFRKDDELLINLMINQLLSDSDPELSDAFLLGYMLRILIDPDNMNNPGVRGEKTEFLSFFYKRCIGTLVRPLFDNTTKEVLEKDDYHTALVLNHILELLTFCIETHTYHMKNYCFNRDLLKRVLVLLQSTHKFLVLAALRLLRRVIHMKEEFYNRYLIKNNLFKPIVKLFVSNGHRYNLLDSAIIELFEYIRSEEITSLITHVVDNFWDILKNITYVQTFADIKRVYDHSHRPNRPSLVGSVGQQGTLDVLSLVNVATSRFQREPRTLEMEEEQWFDQDEEDEDDEEENHLFSHHPPLINGTVNGTNSGEVVPVCSVSEGLSVVPTFDSHSTLPVSTTSELLDSPHITFTALSQSNSVPNSVHTPRDSVFNTNSSSAVSPKGSGTEDMSIAVPTSRVSVPDRPRMRHVDVDNDNLVARPPLMRQATPISIHIKSSLANSTSVEECTTKTATSSFDTLSSDGSKDGPLVSQSEVKDEQSEMAGKEEDCAGPSKGVDSHHSIIGMETDVESSVNQSKRSANSGPAAPKPNKRIRRARASSPKAHSTTTSADNIFSDDLKGTLRTTSCDVPSTTSKVVTSLTDSDTEEDSPVGLVDYSDEESDDEEDEEGPSEGDQPNKCPVVEEPADSGMKVPDKPSDGGSCEVSSSQSVTEVV
ncbi:unnamed protein product [Calicophoron daubneyi]